MTSKEIKPGKETDKQNRIKRGYLLILHNDNIHSFDYVIEALIDVCKHNYEQAAQCTLITHYKGQCDIRKGELAILNKMRNALCKKELNVTIESEK